MKLPFRLRLSLTFRSRLDVIKLPDRVQRLVAQVLHKAPQVTRRLLGGKLTLEGLVSSAWGRKPGTGPLRFGEEAPGYFLDHAATRELATALHRVLAGAPSDERMRDYLGQVSTALGRVLEAGNVGPVGTTVVGPFSEVYEGTIKPEPFRPSQYMTAQPSPSVVVSNPQQGDPNADPVDRAVYEGVGRGLPHAQDLPYHPLFITN